MQFVKVLVLVVMWAGSVVYADHGPEYFARPMKR